LIVAINDRVVATIDDIHRNLSQPHTAASLELSLVRRERKLQVAVEWS
jgi:hypothetical protein